MFKYEWLQDFDERIMGTLLMMIFTIIIGMVTGAILDTTTSLPPEVWGSIWAGIGLSPLVLVSLMYKFSTYRGMDSLNKRYAVDNYYKLDKATRKTLPKNMIELIRSASHDDVYKIEKELGRLCDAQKIKSDAKTRVQVDHLLEDLSDRNEAAEIEAKTFREYR